MRVRDAFVYEDGKVFGKFFLNSTDTKPADGIATGAVCVEVDTGKSFVFDEDTGIYTELKTGGGGDTPSGDGLMEHIMTVDLGHVNTTSTSDVTLEPVSVPNCDKYEFIIAVAHRDEMEVTHLITALSMIYLGGDYYPVKTYSAKWDNTYIVRYASATQIVCKRDTSSAGIRIVANGISDGSQSLNIVTKYSSSAGTIDGNYTCDIYGLSLANFIPLT